MSIGDTEGSGPGRNAPDDAALAALRIRLVGMVGRVCPAWLSAHAEDIVQAALLRILATRKPGEGIDDLRSLYMKKAAYCAMVDEIRRLRRRAEAPDGEEILAGVTDPAAQDPERQTRLAELGAGIRGCLAGMVPARRRAVVLHLQGHSVPEASRLARWSLKQAENLVYRGLADLRRCLTSKGLAPDA